MNMKYKLKRFFQLLGIQAKMDLMWFLRDTKYACLGIFADVFSTISAASGIFMLAWRFDGMAGMDKYEVLFMLGYVMVQSGIFVLFCCANNGHISRIIGRGQLEHLFMQPLSLPVQLMTSGFTPFTGGGLNLISGAAIMAVAAYRLGVPISLGWFLTLFSFLLVSFGIIISLSYLFSSVAFYAPVAAEEISSYVLDASTELSRYPLSGMPLRLQWPLVTFFPAGLIAWFPTMTLMGKTPMELPEFFPAIVAAILFLITRYIFRKGLKHYVKTGANRYVPYGYRR